MTSITIDAREAGTGKTTTVIYPKIQNHINNNEQVIVVVPSLLLQAQYKADLIKLKINPKHIAVINSNGTSANSQFVKAIQGVVCKVIIITHSAFKLINYTKTNTKLNSIHLILDEAFAVSDRFELTNAVIEDENKTISDFKLNDRIVFDDNITFDDNASNHTIVPIKFKQLANIGDFVNTETEKKLQIPNSKYSIAVSSAIRLSNPTTEVKAVDIFVDFDTSVFLNYASVHIAAANFEHHELARAMRHQQIAYDVMYEYSGHRQFKGKIVIHTPVITSEYTHDNQVHTKNDRLNLSLTVKTKNPQYIKSVEQHWNSINNDAYIMLKNTKDDMDVSADNRYEVKSNCHGINDYKDLTAGLFTSAIRPNRGHATHIHNKLQYDTINDAYLAKSAEVHYQSIMRLALRNTAFDGTINICIMDGTLVEYMINNYFFGAKDSIAVVEFVVDTVKDVITDTNTRRAAAKLAKNYNIIKKKAPAKTSTERTRERRAKKKAEQQAKLKELLID